MQSDGDEYAAKRAARLAHASDAAAKRGSQRKGILLVKTGQVAKGSQRRLRALGTRLKQCFCFDRVGGHTIPLFQNIAFIIQENHSFVNAERIELNFE